MSPQLILHVNYVEQGQSIEEMCLKAVAWGYDGIEFRRKKAQMQEEPAAYLDEIHRAVMKSGLKSVIFGFPGANLMKSDSEQRRSEIDDFISFLELALERFTLTVLNTNCGNLRNPDVSIGYGEFASHGSFIATEDHWNQAVSGLQEIGIYAHAHDLRLALETHMVYLHDLPQKTLDLVKRVGNPAIGVNLDYGNAVYLPDRLPLDELIPSMGSHLHYVHLKNSIPIDSTRIPTSLAEGEINHRQLLNCLKKNAFTGPICLEAPRSGDREWFAQQDIFYIKQLLHELDWK